MTSTDDREGRERVVDPAVFERLAESAGLWLCETSDEEVDHDRSAQWEEAVAMLALVIRTGLTQRQQEIVDLYFYEGKTQAEIAVILGISQQVVSKQLFGASRKGKMVGGVIRKLRKSLREVGITFD